MVCVASCDPKMQVMQDWTAVETLSLLLLLFTACSRPQQNFLSFFISAKLLKKPISHYNVRTTSDFFSHFQCLNFLIFQEELVVWMRRGWKLGWNCPVQAAGKYFHRLWNLLSLEYLPYNCLYKTFSQFQIFAKFGIVVYKQIFGIFCGFHDLVSYNL